MSEKPAGYNLPGGFSQAELRQVTVLFCDVVDYTARVVALEPEELAEEIIGLQSLCQVAAEKYRGRIFEFLGDGILALFGHPTANEFAAELAVRAGMEMVEKVTRAQYIHRSAVADSVAANTDYPLSPLRIRIGIATGLSIIGNRRGIMRPELMFGEASNLAARMQELAKPNSIVAAPQTRRLVGAAVKFEDLGSHYIKGFNCKISVWQVMDNQSNYHRTASFLRRVTTRFIGREIEMQLLHKNCEIALAGRGRIIRISGESGIGKSRLVRAFEKTLQSHKLYRLRISCSHLQNAQQFKPIVDAAHQWLQLE